MSSAEIRVKLHGARDAERRHSAEHVTASSQGAQAVEKAKASKQLDGKKEKNVGGKEKSLGCSSCGGTGIGGGKVKTFVPWWKKKERSRGKGGENGKKKKGK